jgi:hypothetical protein
VEDQDKNEQIKNTDTAKVKSKVNGNGKTNTMENPPNLLVMKQVLEAGFSTPFPEGCPFGAWYLLTLGNGGKP